MYWFVMDAGIIRGELSRLHALWILPGVNGETSRNNYQFMGKFADVAPFTLRKSYGACR